MNVQGSGLRRARVMAATAVGLVVVLIGSACGTSPPVATPVGVSPRPVDYAGCTLPVVSASTAITIPGFVNTRTGAYTQARVATNDPVTSPKNPSVYSSVLKRWLPIVAESVSPDGRSYAYLKPGPVSQELHVRDLVSGRDVVIQTFDATFYLETWGMDGIRLGGGTNAWQHWLVDPRSGATVFYPAHAPYPWTHQPGDPRIGGFTSLGAYMLSGDPIWWFTTTATGPEWLFSENATGQRVYLIREPANEVGDFYPQGILADHTGVWVVNGVGPPSIWHWGPQTGLTRINVPGLQGNRAAGMTLLVSGPCF